MFENLDKLRAVEFGIESILKYGVDFMSSNEKIILQHIHSKVYDEINRIFFGIE